MTLGTVKAPTPNELREVAADLGLSFSDDELAQHLAALLPSIAAFNMRSISSDSDMSIVVWLARPIR